MSAEIGILWGHTNHCDRDFTQYLRNSFVRSMGLSRDMLQKPIVGTVELAIQESIIS